MFTSDTGPHLEQQVDYDAGQYINDNSVVGFTR
jgi:hypothetical protein